MRQENQIVPAGKSDIVQTDRPNLRAKTTAREFPDFRRAGRRGGGFRIPAHEVAAQKGTRKDRGGGNRV